MRDSKSGKKVLTALGSTLLSLAAEAGVCKQTEIRTRLSEHGLTVSSPGFAAWLYGEHSAPKQLPEAFAAAFDLSPEKKIRLAVAYSFGQNKSFTEADELPSLDRPGTQAATGHRKVSA